MAIGGRAFRRDRDLPSRLGADVTAPDAFTAVTLVTAAFAARRRA